MEDFSKKNHVEEKICGRGAVRDENEIFLAATPTHGFDFSATPPARFGFRVLETVFGVGCLKKPTQNRYF
jgi:hypothetical protein